MKEVIVVPKETDFAVFDRIANSLESIEKSLRQIANKQLPSGKQSKVIGEEASLELDFLQRITQVYVKEEKMKKEKSLKRKSAVRVSNELGGTIADFLNEHMVNLIASSQEGYILLQREGENKALFRFQTDLGFCRGEAYYDAVKHGLMTARRHGVPEENTFFMIGSIKNSIDHAHVQKILNRENVPSNSVIMTSSNHELLDEYLQGYVNSIPHLTNPDKHIFFLTTDIHPNTLAWEILNENKNVWDNVTFLKPSISKLMETLNSIK